MKKIFFCLVAMLSMGIAASAMSYTEDEQSIDAMIEMATEVTPASMEAEGISDPTISFGAAPQPIVAFILATVPFTNLLAVHRMYMGTSPLAVILHIVTGEGFLIVGIIDWVALLIGTVNNDISAYCNNGRWWMWADII